MKLMSAHNASLLVMIVRILHQLLLVDDERMRALQHTLMAECQLDRLYSELVLEQRGMSISDPALLETIIVLGATLSRKRSEDSEPSVEQLQLMRHRLRILVEYGRNMASGVVELTLHSLSQLCGDNLLRMARDKERGHHEFLRGLHAQSNDALCALISFILEN